MSAALAQILIKFCVLHKLLSARNGGYYVRPDNNNNNKDNGGELAVSLVFVLQALSPPSGSTEAISSALDSSVTKTMT